MHTHTHARVFSLLRVSSCRSGNRSGKACFEHTHFPSLPPMKYTKCLLLSPCGEKEPSVVSHFLSTPLSLSLSLSRNLRVFQNFLNLVKNSQALPLGGGLALSHLRRMKDVARPSNPDDKVSCKTPVGTRNKLNVFSYVRVSREKRIQSVKVLPVA